MNMREAFEKVFGHGDSLEDSLLLAGFQAGYAAAIEAVKAGGIAAWQNNRNGFICKEQSAEYQHPLYKLPEDV
jgi:hypothetical protein